MNNNFMGIAKGMLHGDQRRSQSTMVGYLLPVAAGVVVVLLISTAATNGSSGHFDTIEASAKSKKYSNLTIPPTGVQVSRINCPVPFDYAYLHPDDDDFQVRDPNITALEPGLTRLWFDDKVSLSKCCQEGGFVVDIGSHFGYYALLAGSMGCKVVAAEPVPLFRSVLELNLKMNSEIAHNIIELPYAIGQESKESVNMFVPTSGILGTARIVQEGQPGQVDIQVRQERLDTLLDELGMHQAVCMLKIDVEGQEPDVVMSAKKLVEEKKIRNVMLEFSPGYKKDGLDEMLSLFHNNGYCGIEIPWHWAKFHGRVENVPLDQFIGKAHLKSFASEQDRSGFVEDVATRFNTNLFFSLDCTA